MARKSLFPAFIFSLRFGLLMLSMLGYGVFASDIDTDPSHKYAWSENTGWINAMPDYAFTTLSVRFDGDKGWLSGFLWGENIGWIKMGSDKGGPYTNSLADNWGVNMDTSGKLSGYAWGENVGWIKFDHRYCDARLNVTNGAFSGNAWGQNIGWVNWGDVTHEFGVRTTAFDAQAKGTPNWWLAHYGVAEDYDSGDGVFAARKYIMDVDPMLANNYLRITSVSNSPSGPLISFEPSSTRRYYTLKQRSNLMTGGWSNAVGNINITGSGGEQSVQTENAEPQIFYTIEVSVQPQ